MSTAEQQAQVAAGPVEAVATAWPSTIAASHGQRDYLIRRWLALGDAAAIALALALAFLTSYVHDEGDLVWALPTLPLWIGLFALYGLYTRDIKRISRLALDDVPALFHAFLVGGLVMWLYFRVVPTHPLVFVELVAFGACGLVIVVAMRFAVRRVAARALGPERVLFVGESDAFVTLVRKIRTHPEYALEPAAVVSRDGRRSAIHGLPVVGSLDDPELASNLRLYDVDRVIASEEEVGGDVMLALARECGRLKIKLGLLPRGFGAMGPSMEVDDIEGVTVLGLNPLVLSRSSRLAKRAVDVAGAAAGLVLTAPLMALLAIAIKLDSRGPVLFRQPRLGRHGGLFLLLKFRTMVPEAEAQVAELMSASRDPHWLHLDQDPRVTRVGRFLRRTSLDELPQLWNVLMGDMSLVGPRPLTPADHDKVEAWGRIRLDLAPGITGLWQVLGRTNIPFAEMVKLDYLYVTNWSLWRDIKLLLQTLPAVMRRRGAN